METSASNRERRIGRPTNEAGSAEETAAAAADTLPEEGEQGGTIDESMKKTALLKSIILHSVISFSLTIRGFHLIARMYPIVALNCIWGWKATLDSRCPSNMQMLMTLVEFVEIMMTPCLSRCLIIVKLYGPGRKNKDVKFLRRCFLFMLLITAAITMFIFMSLFSDPLEHEKDGFNDGIYWTRFCSCFIEGVLSFQAWLIVKLNIFHCPYANPEENETRVTHDDNSDGREKKDN